MEESELNCLAEYGAVVENWVDATSSRIYNRHGGHVMMRLFSDVVCTRLLQEMWKMWRIHLMQLDRVDNFVYNYPVLVNVGTKQRSAMGQHIFPGLHLHARLNTEDYDVNYWHKLISQEDLVKIDGNFWVNRSTAMRHSTIAELMKSYDNKVSRAYARKFWRRECASNPRKNNYGMALTSWGTFTLMR